MYGTSGFYPDKGRSFFTHFSVGINITVELPAVCWLTYIILLSFEFLTEIKLLCLQSHQPLPQFIGLLPIKHRASRGRYEIFQMMLKQTWNRHGSFVILQFILIQMVNSERLPAISQDLLLLLPLSLFLASFPAFTLWWSNKEKKYVSMSGTVRYDFNSSSPTANW